MLLRKCAVHNIKKSRFIKKQGASGLLSQSEATSSLSKVPRLGDILF